MNPWHDDDRATIYHGDCLDVLRQLPDASVDSVVTDPPYGLEFMGKDWDAFRLDDPGTSRHRGDRAGKHGQASQDDGRGAFGRVAYGGGKRPTTFRCVTCGKRDQFRNDHACGESANWRKEIIDPHAAPPSMLAFGEWSRQWAAECLRVLKPGGHLLAFGGTRTWHRLAVAIEDAGFEIRDSIAWMYGSGFPKSLDVSKAIDKVNGEGGRLHKFTAWMRTTGLTARELNDATGTFMGSHYLTAKSQPAIPTPDLWALIRPLCGDVPAWVDQLVERIEAERVITQRATRPLLSGEVITFDQRDSTERERRDIPATPDAARWQGWGTALKPAHEPIVVARKPLIGTVAANVLEHGTGGLNIDGCRIGTEARVNPPGSTNPRVAMGGGWRADAQPTTTAGRWPANVVLDEDQAAALDEQSGYQKDGVAVLGNRKREYDASGYMIVDNREGNRTYGGSGGASRFFYVAKAPARERPKVDGVAHPTVKPLTLMRWLCRLVTPPGGVVLEPFAGSGTTIEAALMEGFRVVAIEREADYLPLIQARLDRVAEETDGQLPLDASA